MISKNIMLITFLKEPELIFFFTVQGFHLFLSNNSIHSQSFVTQSLMFSSSATYH